MNYTRDKFGRFKKGMKLSDEQKKKISKFHKGRFNEEKASNWKGDKAKYGAIHAWVRKYKPKSMFCEKCGIITSKLDVANISGKYLRDISDYRWLCRSCHNKEHKTIFNIKKMQGRYQND